jgi:hypothetical protein
MTLSMWYDSKMWHLVVSLANMRPGDFVFFSSYALSGLVLPLSFIFMLLKHYGLQLQHLSSRSIMLVVIFIHFCKVFMGMRPSVCLFRRFHVLRAVSKYPPRIDGYYFQRWIKDPSKYIAALSPGRWDHWREDWVLVQTDAHEQLVLSSAAPTAPHANWEQDPSLELAFNPVLRRISILAKI